MKLTEINPLVSICIPFGRCPLPDWAISLRSIADPMNAQSQIIRELFKKRDIARCLLAKGAIASKSKYILFLDDDVTVHPNIIRKLLFEFQQQPDDVMVIGGIYCSKTSPAIPLVFKKVGEGHFYNWKLGEVFEADIVPTGMMMIKTEVFNHLKEPWFVDVDGVDEGIKYELIPSDFTGLEFKMTDDVYFCQKVREAGFKIMAHGGVLGMHWDDRGAAYILPDDAYPIKSEMEKRWGKAKCGEEEYCKRYMSIIKEFYGYVDLLPVEQEVEAVA